MWSVTAKAVFINHLLCMGFVTLDTLCCLTMGLMTFLTVHVGMCTRMGFHLLALIGVAGETDSLDLVYFRKIHFQGIVRVVADLTFFETIMSRVFRAMAPLTWRNGVFSKGGVFHVTSSTTDVLVQRSSLVDMLGGILMTLATVLLRQ